MGYKILLVENHQDTAVYLQLFLEKTGHSVTISPDVRSTIELPDLESFDIILSDIGLPDGDGWELMQRIRPLTPAYAVAMSGFGMTSDIKRSLAVGYQAHLIKPFTPARLLDVLAKAEAYKQQGSTGNAA
jgi:CheY-like chemotaxis protein